MYRPRAAASPRASIGRDVGTFAKMAREWAFGNIWLDSANKRPARTSARYTCNEFTSHPGAIAPFYSSESAVCPLPPPLRPVRENDHEFNGFR